MGNKLLDLLFYLFSYSKPFDSEKAMAPHSSTLAWKIPWMQEPGRLQSMGLLRVRHDWANSLSLFTFMHWRRKWQPTPGMGEPGGLPSMGSHRVGHDCSDLAAAYSIGAQQDAMRLFRMMVLVVSVCSFSLEKIKSYAFCIIAEQIELQHLHYKKKASI